MTEFPREGSRVPPRFVPTLTEVVTPSFSEAAARIGPAISESQLEQVVAVAMQRAEISLTQRLPEVVAVLLHEHALAMTDRLQRDIRSVVHQSVKAALLSELGIGDRAQGDGTQPSPPSGTAAHNKGGLG
jgi:hypothetical protein